MVILEFLLSIYKELMVILNNSTYAVTIYQLPREGVVLYNLGASPQILENNVQFFNH